MDLVPPPLLAMHGDEVIAILAIGSFWFTVISITLGIAGLSHRRKSRESELGAEMVRDMLSRKLTPDEIERVLCAWAGRRVPLKKLVKSPEQAPALVGKPVSALA